jgi:hypothetical protein
MVRLLRGVTFGAVILLLASATAFAQLSTAQLSGKVTDTSGAVLPGVSVTMTQTDTKAARTVVTDADGAYVISNLPTGPYQLEVMLEGFRSYVQTGIVLQVAATPTINVALELGSLTETVTVEGAAPIVDVKSAGIRDVVENERIVELPLQGRQVTDLIVLAGGAVNTGSPNSRNFGGVNIAVAGGQPFGVAYLLDGAMHNDPQSNANLPLPFPDALQEFSVATSGLSAQNGMHSGASVNAITKSGTNNLHGNAFEFLRDHRFNATNPFARVLPSGKRQDDGLVRNQFGGTLGGPIVKNRLFFFGGYQGTATRQTPAANIAYVPTAAMLAGDFSAFTSPACNGGRQISLRAPYVNNQINPALYSPAALNLARRLPKTTDPCGLVTYSVKDDNNEGQGIGRADMQWSQDHSMFGRYMATYFKQAAAYEKDPTNVLVTNDPGLNNLAQSFTFGDTLIISSTTVNSIRGTFNRTSVNRYQAPFFDPKELGINVYSYNPHEMVVAVNPGGFAISAGTATKGVFHTNTYQFNDDLSLVRGRHEMSFGVDLARWQYRGESHARSGGNWTVNGQVTGAALADFLIGRVTTLEHGGPGIIPVHQTYFATYMQDTFRAGGRVTLNVGLRWEPYFGQTIENGAVSNFSLENFRKGVRSTVYRFAPAGFLYPGDPGFPKGMTGLNKQWWNLSPRGGLAWDITGDGRLAFRTSYSMAYDFPNADYHNINASAPPFGNRSLLQDPPGLLDDPYRTYGGDPHPIVTNADTRFVSYGSFGAIDPGINSPRVQTWNATIEKQLGTKYGVAASYLGSYSDRLWGQVALNPGEFLGTGPCTLNGVNYPVCTVNSNLDQRRVLRDPLIGVVDQHSAVGTQSYRGLKLTGLRRGGSGLTLNGNYTWSRCFGTATPGSFPQLSTGFTNPKDPSFDRGHCTQDRTHIVNFTMGYETPTVGGVLGVLASHWRVSGILNANSGSWLNIITGQDNAGNGINNQRPNKVSDDVYGAKTLQAFLNVNAFAQPAPGTFGNLQYNSIKGPGFWKIDMALTRNIVMGTRNVELRLETFNLLNHFNWGNPAVNLNNRGTFGRITTMQGAPRIMQFGVKFGF